MVKPKFVKTIQGKQKNKKATPIESRFVQGK